MVCRFFYRFFCWFFCRFFTIFPDFFEQRRWLKSIFCRFFWNSANNVIRFFGRFFADFFGKLEQRYLIFLPIFLRIRKTHMQIPEPRHKDGAVNAVFGKVAMLSRLRTSHYFWKFVGNHQKWTDLARTFSTHQKLSKSVHGRKTYDHLKLLIFKEKMILEKSSYYFLTIFFQILSQSSKIMKSFLYYSFSWVTRSQNAPACINFIKYVIAKKFRIFDFLIFSSIFWPFLLWGR